MNKIAFLAGLAIGYVLGARAGRERYEEIRVKAHEFAESPRVQDAAHKLGEGVAAGAQAGKAKLHEAVEKVEEKKGQKQEDDANLPQSAEGQPPLS